MRFQWGKNFILGVCDPYFNLYKLMKKNGYNQNGSVKYEEIYIRSYKY